ncbi:hypothetical protein BDZ91DRAFT_715814 [Kalaharituber pfeilii]|nr:hypothetical protein BDZ91DRAFT_715814 [Kalaharituber pfeilii]
MAAIETSSPHLTAIGPELSAGGTSNRGSRRRGRHHGGRGSRRGGAGNESTGHEHVNPDPLPTGPVLQQQQQNSGGRQRSARLYEEVQAGAAASSSQSSSANAQAEQVNPGPRPRRPFNRHRRGDGARTETEASQQLNWQQQLLLENTYQQSSNPRNQSGGHRGGRGGGQQSGRNRRQPQAQPDSPVRPTSAPHPERPGRGRIVPPRGFGAQLTVGELSAPTASSALHPTAPAFEPGQVINNDKRLTAESDVWSKDTVDTDYVQPVARAQPVKTVKEAEDLMTRIHSGLASGSYECMICYGGVTRKSQVWYCGRCYAVFHLKCIQKWAKQGLEAPLPPHALQNGEEPRRTWRCPGCQNQAEEAPSEYSCWCGKMQNPDVQRYIPPHSCGQPCGKQRTSPRACPHACNLQCHSGPCPPCTAMGPAQPCYCGKETSQRRCLDTDYENGWSCQQICGDYMPCGEHTCPRPCHPGMCGDCEFEEELGCYCGKELKFVRCCDKGTPVMSAEIKEEGKIEWIGHWSCNTVCERFFDCCIHKCNKKCHSIDEKPARCPFSPDIVTHCPCGKTEINDILSSPRQKCDDPIPSCDKKCNKTLKCGHKCQQVCHTDDCGICLEHVQIACRCGRTSANILCHQRYEYERPQCRRICKTILNCQRHECGEKCCPGEAAALDRIAASKKKKNRPLNSILTRTDETYEPEHICTRPCGRLLKCGKHPCPMLCHRGPCGTCLEASFRELACHCGRTVLYPPVPCGSRPPPCTYQCTRGKSCSHPQTPHNCHGDEDPCPKCPYLTVKRCLCGKTDVKHQPCWRETVTCGTICGKRLSCGSHTCKKVCHKAGECDEPCTQPCGKSRACGHLCTDACHAPFQCSEATPCQAKIQISCPCGGIKQEVKCNASKTNVSSKQKEIKCNDACRARRLALALEIDPDRDSLQQGYSDETIAMYQEQPKQFTQSIEKSLRAFAESPQKRYSFAPMKSVQRQFIHNLAADFGLESESQDPEPYRSVVVMKGPKFLMAPKKTIAEFMQTFVKPSATSTQAPTPTPAPLIEQLRKPKQQACNSIVLEGIRVGLLMTELEKELDPIIKTSQLRFNITWTADEEVILEPKTSSFGMDEIELELTNLKPALRRIIMSKGLAQGVELCWVGRDGKIMHKESQKWAVVAGSSKASSSTASAWAVRAGIAISHNGFGALDSSPAGRMMPLGVSRSSESLREMEKKEKGKGKKKQEEVVDDWEMAADDDEEINETEKGIKEEVKEEVNVEIKEEEPASAAVLINVPDAPSSFSGSEIGGVDLLS